MVQITMGVDCGNSPKNEFIKAINIAFANGDIDFLSESVTDGITWSIVGEKKIKGKTEFIKELKELRSDEILGLRLEHVLAHGKLGAASGILSLTNGKEFAFSDVYEFQSANASHLTSITSYVIEIT